MAKYRLKNTLVGGFREVNCNILHESAGSYVVQFENGVVRRVPKRRVYRLNRIDEGVLDTIRDAGKRLFSGLKKVGKYVAAFIGDAILPTVSPVNTAVVAKDIPGLSVSLGSDAAALAHSVGVTDTTVIDDTDYTSAEDLKNIESYWTPIINFVEKRNLKEGVFYKKSHILNEAGNSLLKKYKSFHQKDDSVLTPYDEFKFDKKDDLELNSELDNYTLANYLRKIRDDKNARARFTGGNQDYINTIAGKESSSAGAKSYDGLCYEIKREMTRRARGNATQSDCIVIWGAPGIGKTEIIRQMFKEARARFGGTYSIIEINLAPLTKPDIALPSVRKVPHKVYGVDDVATDVPKAWMPVYKEIETANELPPKFVEIAENLGLGPRDKDRLVDVANSISDIICNGGDADINDAGELVVNREGTGGLLFIDELSRVDGEVMNFVMTLISSRTAYKGYRVGSRWTIVFAANRLSDMYDPREGNAAEGTADKFVWEKAFTERTVQYCYIPSFDRWKAWWNEKGLNADVMDFLEHNMKLWLQRPIDAVRNVVDDNQDRTQAGGSPRSWVHFATRLNYFLRDAENYATYKDLVHKCGSPKSAEDTLEDIAVNGKTPEERKNADELLDFILSLTPETERQLAVTNDFLTIPDSYMQELMIATVGPAATAFFQEYRDERRQFSPIFAKSAWVGHPVVPILSNKSKITKYEIDKNRDYITPDDLGDIKLDKKESARKNVVSMIVQNVPSDATDNKRNMFNYYLNIIKFFFVLIGFFNKGRKSSYNCRGDVESFISDFNKKCQTAGISIPSSGNSKNALNAFINKYINTFDNTEVTDETYKTLYSELKLNDDTVKESIHSTYRNRLHSHSSRYNRRYRINESLEDELNFGRPFRSGWHGI
jgi:hypothetical protein